MGKGAITLAKATVYPYFDSKETAKIKPRDNLNEKGLVGSNCTSSVTDEVFHAFRNRRLTVADKNELKNWPGVLNKSKDAIRQHFEKRVSQLFIQAVLCYKTNYRFREGHTVHQGYGAHRIGEMEFNAAHHATIPLLYAYSPDTKREVAFNYRSGFYDESNATIDIIDQVNEADRAIDEKTKTSLLREKVVTLLNKAAKAELTPPQIIKRFMKAAIEEIDKAILIEPNPQVVDVLKIYRKLADELTPLVKDPKILDFWLNLRMDDPILIKPGITYQELIKRKIHDLPIVIHNERHEKTNESHIPAHFHDLYRHKVLSQFQGKELKVLEQALGITFDELDEKVQSFIYVGRTNKLIERHAKKIDQLKNELEPLISRKQDKAVKKELLTLSASKKICLRPSIYRLRYGMISADQKAQSTIKSLFDSTLNQIKNGKRANHFDDFFYHSVFSKMPNASDKKIFAGLLNTSPSTLNQKIREVKVNELAHSAISSYASDISRIWKKISKNTKTDQELKDKIHDVVKQIADSSSADRKTIKKLCHRRLYDWADTQDKRKRLEALIDSQNTLDDWIAKNTKTKAGAAEKLINPKIGQIENAVTDALKKVADLKEKTDQYKSKLLLELREASGLKQESFLEEFNKKYNSKMSHAQLIDLEKGRTAISSERAERIAKVYGVSSTLFFPSNFAELEN